MMSVIKSIENLMSFPCVRILNERGKLHLHGAYFDVTTGVLQVLDQKTRMFSPIEPEARARVSLFRATPTQ